MTTKTKQVLLSMTCGMLVYLVIVELVFSNLNHWLAVASAVILSAIIGYIIQFKRKQ